MRLRRSVPGSSEQVVDAHLERLNAAAVGRKHVADQEGGTDWNDKGAAGETDPIELGFHRPVVRKGVLQAQPKHAAGTAAASVAANRYAGGRVGDDEVAHTDLANAELMKSQWSLAKPSLAAGSTSTYRRRRSM